MKPSGIGGQAVIEGVMMKNKDQYAIAVRKADHEIVVEKKTFVSGAQKYKILKLPIFRGVLAFVESMIIGSKTLSFSASFFEEEEETKQTKLDLAFSKVFKEKAESVIMGLTFVVAILLAVGIFIVLPAFTANLLGQQIESDTLLAVVEGGIRILLFVLYVLAISQIKDIKRVFMYHGAEHKTINCLEQGFELTVENVKWQSRQHKRCGTSFMFIVMFVSIIFFIFIRVDSQWLRYLIRILLIPVIAGVSYEFIRFAGKSDSKIVQILSQPGLWLQGLTTREPDDEMIEVAIQSVEAVFDWKEFLEPSGEKSKKTSKGKNNKNSKKYNSSENRSHNKANSNNNQKNKANTNTTKNSKKSSYQEQKEESKDISEVKNDKYIKQANGKKTLTEATKTLTEGTKTSAKTKDQTTLNNQTKEQYKEAEEEMAVTVSKELELSKNAVFGEEEDEILKALDYYLVSKEEIYNKE